jgi:hypothetical protein
VFGRKWDCSKETDRCQEKEGGREGREEDRGKDEKEAGGGRRRRAGERGGGSGGGRGAAWPRPYSGVQMASGIRFVLPVCTHACTRISGLLSVSPCEH